MATYVVTGGAGFIGSHLIEALLERGDAVRNFDSFTDYYPRELKEANVARFTGRSGFSLHEADVAAVPPEELLENADGVFHLAAQPGVRGSWGTTFDRYVEDNVLATQRVFEAASSAGRRVVWASSSSVYGNAEAYPTNELARPRPISPYGVTKLSCEYLASAYAASRRLDHVALRYFTVYGPRQRPDMAFARIVNALADGGTFTVLGSGEQSRDVTYVGDAVAATIAAMERGVSGRVYNVGGGSETSLAEAIRICGTISGRTLAVRHEGAATGDVQRTAADTRRARADLGWVPKTPVEDGLRRHLAWRGVSADG